jgi:hypothetical protein
MADFTVLKDFFGDNLTATHTYSERSHQQIRFQISLVAGNIISIFPYYQEFASHLRLKRSGMKF